MPSVGMETREVIVLANEVLKVSLLGPVSLSVPGSSIDDNRDRSRKVWLLLSYLIYNRRRPIPQEELINLLRCQEGANPVGALKTMMHRARNVLEGLFKGAGHELIIYKNGCYRWSETQAVQVDVDDFESYCKRAEETEDEDEAVELYLKAIQLYEDDFLKKLSSEIWVVPISVYYHRMFIDAAMNALPKLAEMERFGDMAEVALKAITLEPYQEEFYQYRMTGLTGIGKQKQAVALYEDLCSLLLNEFGTIPSEETRLVYRKALAVVDHHTLYLDTIRRQLEEPTSASGAMICEYDFFRILYQAKARAIVRSGDAVHIALLTVSEKSGSELSDRSTDKAMENLQELIRTNLRKGDIASRCSITQFILMLPEANYENSCMVCRRVITAFARKYPHSQAHIEFAVMPLEPNL